VKYVGNPSSLLLTFPSVVMIVGNTQPDRHLLSPLGNLCMEKYSYVHNATWNIASSSWKHSQPPVATFRGKINF